MRILGILLLVIIFFVAIFYGLENRNISTKLHVKTPETPYPSSSHTSPIPTSVGSKPNPPLTIAPGFTIHVFASGLDNPRDEVFSPGGTLLVSDPNDGKVFALPDKNDDGTADTKKIIISGQNHPHGLAFYHGKLFLADVNKVIRYSWNEQTLTATQEKILFSLPANNDHNSRTIAFDNSGNMYVSVGSTCNVCIDNPPSGTILMSDENGTNPHVFATGLRNAAFLAINPLSGQLWATEMGRDYLGDNAPPDEIDSIQAGLNYGWPYCYGNQVHDDDFDPKRTHSCTDTEPPIYEIPAHSAPLGLVFIHSNQFPNDWQNDLLVAYHGSWNRSTPIGYKVVHLKVSGNSIINSQDFLTGFAPTSTPNTPLNNSAVDRPVDLAFDSNGNLYLSDDKGGNIYIIQKSE